LYTWQRVIRACGARTSPAMANACNAGANVRNLGASRGSDSTVFASSNAPSASPHAALTRASAVYDISVRGMSFFAM
jgi:hypothetical protein